MSGETNLPPVPAQPERGLGKPKTKSSWLNMLIDFGPVLIFFIVHKYLAPSDADKNPLEEVNAVIKSTSAFVLASIVALLFSRWKFGRISPMLWLTTILVVGFGAITIYTGQAAWIRHKPTAIYLLFAAILFVGLAKGRALLKYLLEAAFEGLDEDGWRKLSRNWAVFFVFLAALNEVLNLKSNGAFRIDMNTWIAAKIWLFVPLSFLFTFTQLPMLLRHGLLQEAEGEVLADPPHGE